MKQKPDHALRITGGIGTVLFVYAPLRLAEAYAPAIVFLVLFLLLGYALGWLLDRSGI